MSDTTNSTPASHDDEGTPKPGGVGDDKTIPDSDDGLAVSVTEEDTHFNAEEDPEA
ncbi:hypothetical protein [Marisediminicola sp. LYQ85]|uniref:hypothetical protein n=1 Tax=Marisediminicola sp. LYQ85 TaxID=3391062 RepID=UPI003982FBE9